MTNTFVFDLGMNSSTSSSSSSSPTRGLLTPDDNITYDKERLQWRDSASVPRWTAWPRKHLRVPRLRKATFCLLLIELIIVGLVVRAFEPLITLLVRNQELFGARLTLPVNDTSFTDFSDQRTIPRILHQTGPSETIPERWVASVQSCKDAYSDFEYKLWTDDLARDFISTEYPWFVDTWDNYPFNIQRADAIRYFVLYHYGGMYLDMDTICNKTIPLHQLEADGGQHHAAFKSTTPTGVSNDFMVTSAHHPAFNHALSRILFYNEITTLWARFLPHAAIMVSAGPFFVTMALKNWLLEQPSLPTPQFHVINATELAPYITDLEGCSWHHGDTQILMWVGDRPWVWFSLGAIGLVISLSLINRILLLAWKELAKLPSVPEGMKVAKLT